MSRFTLKQWAILITAVVHTIMVLGFAYLHVEYNPDKDWSHVRMNFAEEEPIVEEKKEQFIPENYEEHGLDQKKYSVAKTNQAINEATEQLSKGEQERIEQEIEAQVNQMAKDASTTGFMEAGNESKLGGSMSAPKKENKQEKKSGKEDGEEDLGNAHDMTTNITYYLKERKERPNGLYNPVYLCQVGGKVVVNIVVNPSGEVISASINEAKSLSSDPCLKQAAKKAALQSYFNQSSNAPSKQRGIITYQFTAQ